MNAGYRIWTTCSESWKIFSMWRNILLIWLITFHTLYYISLCGIRSYSGGKMASIFDVKESLLNYDGLWLFNWVVFSGCYVSYWGSFEALFILEACGINLLLFYHMIISFVVISNFMCDWIKIELYRIGHDGMRLFFCSSDWPFVH